MKLNWRSLFRPSGRRLFIKIFWVFWGAMSFAGILLLAIEANRAEKLQSRTRAINGDAVAFYAVSVTRDHEDEQSWQSRKFLKDLESRTGIRGWLFDMQGREVSGHDVAQLRYLEEETSVLTRLREAAEGTTQTVFEPLNTVTLAAHTALSPSGKRYTFIGMLPQSRFGPWEARPIIQVLRILAMFIVAGIVSWILAVQLTRPIATLRKATHRLAEGDLTARVSAAEYQRDELGELSRDFNLMAERLEASMHEQTRLIVVQKRLLGDVAHELRSPLARINVALELARDASHEIITETSVPAETAFPLTSAHDRIEREVGRLSELIDRLLTLSRLESGVQRRDELPVDLDTLLEIVTEDANFEARPSKRVIYCNDFSPNHQGSEESPDWIVSGTPDLLRSAVENIVRNAVRHTPPETSVEVMLRRERNDAPEASRWYFEGENCYVSLPILTLLPPAFGWAVISVRDHGPGVPASELREVFQPFYRAGKGRAQRDGGVGLGLAITLRAVELHDGQVRACNVENGGLMIEIRLPLSLKGQFTC